MEQVLVVLESLVNILTYALPVIGITGGVKSLFDSLPDLKLGPITVKDGLWVSWLIAGLAVLAGIGLGNIAVDFTGEGVTDIAKIWGLIGLAANALYSMVYRTTPE